MLKFNIKTKLLLAFLLTVIFSSIAGITGIVLLGQTDQTYRDTLTDYGFIQGNLGKLGESFQRHRASVLYIISAENQENRETQKKQLEADVATIDADMVTLGSAIRMDSDKKIYADLQAKMDEYKGYRDQTVALADTSPTDAMLLFRQECAPRASKIEEIIDALMVEKSTTGTALSTQLSNQSRTFIFIMVVIILLAITISVIVSLKITKSVTRPLGELTNAARNLACGNLSVDISYTANDEIGEVSSSMRSTVSTLQVYIGEISRLLESLSSGQLDVNIETEFLGDFAQIDSSLRRSFANLNHTLSQINQSSDQVASGSDQVASGAQALSQGATEQASSVEELAATINEISQQVKDTSANAISARQQTDATGAQITTCNEQMQEMIQAISEISQKSTEIGKIIKTIEDIAFQTNILALNAAVEAARAGAAGKGFAVVADEVRNLASKSAEASKNTAVLIEGSIHAVEKGTHIATETAQTLVQVVQGAQQVVAVVTKITDATTNQASSIAQVTQGIDQISNVVQTNSATAEQSAAASEELSGQAQILKNLVGQFQLKNDDGVKMQTMQQPY